MTNLELFVLGIDHAAAAAAGAWIGYSIRGVVERRRARRLREDARTTLAGRLKNEHTPFQVIPLRRDKRQVTVVNTDGEDVVAALVAAGFKKTVATMAAAQCLANERITVETWTAAALRNAASVK